MDIFERIQIRTFRHSLRRSKPELLSDVHKIEALYQKSEQPEIIDEIFKCLSGKTLDYFINAIGQERR